MSGKRYRLAAAAIGGILLGLALASFALSYLYVHSITQLNCPNFGRLPESVGLTGYQEVEFKTTDGLTLRGWHVPGSNGATIILLEGIGARGGMLAEGEILARHGYGLLLFDWRGCGTSQPAQHTLGYDETLDLLGAVDFVERTDSDAIGALGFSLGGAVAIRGAASDPRIGAVVAMGNYHDLEAEIYGAGDDSPLLSAIFEREIAWIFQRITGVDFDRELEPVELIAMISPRPLLLIFGEREEALPPPSGRILLEAASEPRELWLLPGVGHGGYLGAAPTEFEQRVVEFFDSALLH